MSLENFAWSRGSPLRLLSSLCPPLQKKTVVWWQLKITEWAKDIHNDNEIIIPVTFEYYSLVLVRTTNDNDIAMCLSEFWPLFSAHISLSSKSTITFYLLPLSSMFFPSYFVMLLSLLIPSLVYDAFHQHSVDAYFPLLNCNACHLPLLLNNASSICWFSLLEYAYIVCSAQPHVQRFVVV